MRLVKRDVLRNVETGESFAAIRQQKRQWHRQLLAAACVAGIGAAAERAVAATVTWTGAAGDKNWSDPGNWTGGVPAGNDVVFTNNGAATTPNTVNNIVDATTTVNSVAYNNFFNTTQTANVFFTTQIGTGTALNVSGSNGFKVGALTSPNGVIGYNTSVYLTGGGTLNVNNAAANFIVSNEQTPNNGGSNATTAFLDMSGLGTFKATVNDFAVGSKIDGTVATGARTSGNIILADTNNITANTMMVGWVNGNGRSSSMKLGRVNNFNVDNIFVGREKGGPSSMTVNPSASGSATLTLRGKAGGTNRVGTFSVADFSGQSTSATNPGTELVDWRGVTVDALINNFNIAVGQTTTGSGPAVGVVNFAAGSLNVTALNLAKTTSTTAGAAPATGTLNVSGGTVTAGSILLANQGNASGAVATGILNMTGGRLNVTTGDIADGGGLSTLNIGAGAIVDLNPAGRTNAAGSIGSIARPIDTFTLDGTILNVNNVSIFNALSGSGSISNLTGTFTYDDNGSGATFAGSIGGTGSFNKVNNSGSLSLTGGNTFSGTTTISSGSISLDSGGSLASSVVVNSGSSFLVNAGGSFTGRNLTVNTGATFDSTGAGGLTFNGTGRTVSSSGTFNGPLIVGSGAAISPGSIGAAATFQTNNDVTLNSATLNIDMAPTTDVGSNINDLIAAGGNLSLLGNNVVNLKLLGPSLATGTYTIATYSGSLTGNTNNLSIAGAITESRRTLQFDTSTANQVNLIVGGSNPATLVWTGDGSANRWNVRTDVDWLNGATPDQFYTLDNVTFDDTGSANNNVNIAARVVPASVTVNSSANYTFSGTGNLSGPASLTKSGSGTLTIVNSGGNDYFGGTILNGGTINIGNGGTTGDVGPGPFTNSANLVINRSDAYTFLPALSGTGSVSIASGVTTLAGDSPSFDGNIVVQPGATLKLNGPGQNTLGSTVGTTTISPGATLDVANDVANSQNLASAEQVIVSGSGVNGAGAITNSNATNNQQNTLQSILLAGDTTFGSVGRWDIRGGVSTLSTGGHPYSLTISGNTNTGYIAFVGTTVDPALANIVINGGILSIETNSSGALGNATNSILINPGGTLQLWQLTSAITKPITLNGGTIKGLSVGTPATNNTINSNVTVTADSTLDGTANVTVAGTISGSNTLTKIGGSTFTLAGDNTPFTGSIRVTAGTLVASNDKALGSTNAGVLLQFPTNATGGAGSTLQLANGATLSGEPLTMTSQLTGDFRSSLQGQGAFTNTYNGPITTIGDGNFQFTANTAGGTLVINGPVNGSGGVALIRGAGNGVFNAPVNLGPTGGISKTDDGMWTINSVGNNWGTSQISRGVLQLGATNALPVTAPLVMGQAASGNVGTFDMNGFNQTVPSLSIAAGSTAAATNHTVTNSNSAVVSTLTINGDVDSAYAGKIVSNVALVKSGAGTFTLASGVNTYTGGTTINAGTLAANTATSLGDPTVPVTINAGTLLLNGSFATAQPIVLNHSASTIDVSGTNTATIGSPLSGPGSLTKGSNTGTLVLGQTNGVTLPNLTANGGTLSVGDATAGGLAAPLTVNGALSINNNANVNLAPAASTAARVTGNSVNQLSIGTNGLLDIGNHFLTVDNTATPESAVRQYLHNGYNADPTGIGNWLGRGGITSSDAIKSHNVTQDFHVSVGYVNGAYASDPLINGPIPGQETLPLSKILIRPALYGDFNLDGKVDDTDLQIFSGLGQYNQPTDRFGWLGGDLNHDGKVDDTDLQIFSGAGNYNGPAYGTSAAAHAYATPAAPSLTGHVDAATGDIVLSAATSVGAPGDGILDLVYDPSTGHLKVSYDGDSRITAANPLQVIRFKSAGGHFIPANFNGGGFSNTTTDNSTLNGTILGGGSLPDGYDLGAVLASGLQTSDLISDLTLQWNVSGGGLSLRNGDVVVPEPAALGLIGLGAVGLLSRRSRRSRRM